MASIEQRTTKSGEARFRVVWWEDGERQQRTFFDRPSAAEWAQRVKDAGNRWPPGTDPREKLAEDALTFRVWAEKAIDHRTRASERTKADYRRDLGRHFALLNDIPLAALTVEHVVKWMDYLEHAVSPLTKRPLSEKTRRNLHGFASSVMADALSQHPPLAAHNPFADRLTERASVRTEEMVFLTAPEFHRILSLVPDERHYRELIEFLFATGLRYGEATALQVRDVDLLGRRTLTVTKAWKRTGSKDYVIGEPKTRRSRRTISLSGELVDLLVPLVASRRPDELLFPGAAGGRLPQIEVYKRAWAPAVARANVCDTHYAQQRDGRGNPPTTPKPCHCPTGLGKKPRLHDLRHSHASFLIAAGLELAAISRRLGHSSIQITIDRYGHLDPSFDQRINAAVDKALARTLG